MTRKADRQAEPIQYASGYTLDLYCDHWGGPNSPTNTRPDGVHSWSEFPHTFTGETFDYCARVARRRGWVIRRRTRTATCPKCSGKPHGRRKQA